MVTRDDLIIAGDLDRATLWVLDPMSPELRDGVRIGGTDEPGRMVEDAAGHVHVVLRRAGEILEIDLVEARAVGRRAVCPAPRGIDFDDEAGLLWVACAGGELVALLPQR